MLDEGNSLDLGRNCWPRRNNKERKEWILSKSGSAGIFLLQSYFICLSCTIIEWVYMRKQRGSIVRKINKRQGASSICAVIWSNRGTEYCYVLVGHRFVDLLKYFESILFWVKLVGNILPNQSLNLAYYKPK